MIRQPSSCSADGYRPGGVYAPESLAAFSAMPLNSPAVQARTVSILESEPLAAAAMPIATAPTTFTAMSVTAKHEGIQYEMKALRDGEWEWSFEPLHGPRRIGKVLGEAEEAMANVRRAIEVSMLCNEI